MSRIRLPGHEAAARRRRHARLFAATTLLLALVGALWSLSAAAGGAALETVAVRGSTVARAVSYDGTVQAVRQTVVAAQVSGAVTALAVKSGDRVSAGQVLARLDARAAEQTAAAGTAQVQVARAAEEAAQSELQRQRQLFAANFISRAALDRAEAHYKAAHAEVAAQLAGAGASRTSSEFYVVRAPYAGIVADVAVVLGDMAMPGRPLMTLYDPGALRVSVNVPQTAAARLGAAPARVELPGAAAESAWLSTTSTEVLPTADPTTHTVEMRLGLPPHVPGTKPGMFVRAWLPATTTAGDEQRLWVPLQSVVRRAELAAVYVVAADGRPMLRQVRVGRPLDLEIEILAGVAAGERVALDPQAAARIGSSP
jgi:RND family efflux transporter MFP subunit